MSQHREMPKEREDGRNVMLNHVGGQMAHEAGWRSADWPEGEGRIKSRSATEIWEDIRNGAGLIYTTPEEWAHFVRTFPEHPALLDEVEQLRAEVERLRAAIEGVVGCYANDGSGITARASCEEMFNVARTALEAPK